MRVLPDLLGRGGFSSGIRMTSSLPSISTCISFPPGRLIRVDSSPASLRNGARNRAQHQPRPRPRFTQHLGSVVEMAYRACLQAITFPSGYLQSSSRLAASSNVLPVHVSTNLRPSTTTRNSNSISLLIVSAPLPNHRTWNVLGSHPVARFAVNLWQIVSIQPTCVEPFHFAQALVSELSARLIVQFGC